VSFAATTLCVASQRLFVVVVYFVIDSVRKLLDTSSYTASQPRNTRTWNVLLNENLELVQNKTFSHYGEIRLHCPCEVKQRFSMQYLFRMTNAFSFYYEYFFIGAQPDSRLDLKS